MKMLSNIRFYGRTFIAFAFSYLQVLLRGRAIPTFMIFFFFEAHLMPAQQCLIDTLILPATAWNLEQDSPDSSSISIQIFLGSEAQTLNRIHGAKLNIPLEYPLNENFSWSLNLEDSWLTSDGNGDAAFGVSPTRDTLWIVWYRPLCQDISGAGLLGRLQLGHVGPDAKVLLKQERISGIVLIENADFKHVPQVLTRPEQIDDRYSICPIFVQQRQICFSSDFNDPLYITISNLNGQHFSFELGALKKRCFQLDQFHDGTIFVHIQHQGGSFTRKFHLSSN